MGRIAMSLRDDAHMELMSLLEALRDRTLTTISEDEIITKARHWKDKLSQ